MLITQLCPTLFDPMDCISPGSSVHGVLQARILDWVAIPFSRGSSLPRDQTQVSWIAGGFFTIWAIIWKPKGFQREARWKHWLSSLVGSTVHGIFQARMMEWVAISSSRESSWPRDQTHVSCIPCVGRQILYHCCILLIRKGEKTAWRQRQRTCLVVQWIRLCLWSLILWLHSMN